MLRATGRLVAGETRAYLRMRAEHERTAARQGEASLMIVGRVIEVVVETHVKRVRSNRWIVAETYSHEVSVASSSGVYVRAVANLTRVI